MFTHSYSHTIILFHHYHTGRDVTHSNTQITKMRIRLTTYSKQAKVNPYLRRLTKQAWSTHKYQRSHTFSAHASSVDLHSAVIQVSSQYTTALHRLIDAKSLIHFQRQQSLKRRYEDKLINRVLVTRAHRVLNAVLKTLNRIFHVKAQSLKRHREDNQR